VISFEDFGGEGPVLHFAHANAYPIQTYEPFLAYFTNDYHVIGMDQRPMWEDQDPTTFSDWTVLADDIISFIEEQSVGQVIGAGHSMGAVATLIASIKRPELFSKLVLIDPVILPSPVYDFQEGKSIEERKALNPMIQIASKRRNQWETIEEAKTYFESKSFYQKFSTASQEAFLTHGIKKNDAGYTLAYPREWEAMVYATASDPWPSLSEIKHLCMIVRGEHSDVMRSEKEWQAVKDVATQAFCYQMDGAGHLIPQEAPEDLSQEIKRFLSQ